MNDSSTRILNAAVAGQEVMDDAANLPLWTGRAAISNKKTALDNKIAEIETLADSETDGSGVTAGKKAAKDAAAKTAWKIAKPLAVYASDIGDTDLAGEIDFEWSELRYGKDEDVIDDWQLIHDRANTHSAALAAGGYIDVIWITDLQTQITAFEDKRGKPKAKRSSNKAINDQIELKIKELQTIKTDLLDLLVIFAENNPLFYNAAKAAFEKDMTGIRHIALRLRFVDEVLPEIRIPGVKGKIAELNIEKVSSRKGVIEYSHQELAQGNYTLQVKAATYKDQTIANIGIQTGKLKTLEVVLQKGESGGGKGSINGTVTFMGNPAPAAKITLNPTGTETNTNGTGNYSFADVGEGTYSVTAELPPSPANPSGVSQTKPAFVTAGGVVTVNFSF
ncbi:MAG: hypothetical protein POELPBGB_03466 [Bacteroidia bacterium]|nr:hypothetical protein [Bacteroidia bacterium]